MRFLRLDYLRILKSDFIEQSKEWINDKEMPIAVKEMYKENVLKATGLA